MLFFKVYGIIFVSLCRAMVADEYSDMGEYLCRPNVPEVLTINNINNEFLWVVLEDSIAHREEYIDAKLSKSTYKSLDIKFYYKNKSLSAKIYDQNYYFLRGLHYPDTSKYYGMPIGRKGMVSGTWVWGRGVFPCRPWE